MIWVFKCPLEFFLIDIFNNTERYWDERRRLRLRGAQAV